MIEDAGAVGFSAGNAEGHFGESAGGIDGVVMSEHEELTGGRDFCGDQVTRR